MRNRFNFNRNGFMRFGALFALVVFALVVLLNISLLQNIPKIKPTTYTNIICTTPPPQPDQNVSRKLVLAELVEYYENLLQQKGVNTKSIQEAIQNKSGRIFNVFVDPESNEKHDEFIEKETPQSKPAKDEYRKVSYRELGSTDVFKGAIVDWWFDFCMQRESSEFIWHPLFPRMPRKTSIVPNLEDEERVLGQSFRRIYAYLFTREAGSYDFKLSSRDGAEILLLDSGLTLVNIDKLGNLTYSPTSEIMDLKLTKQLMDTQDKQIKLTEMFSNEKKNIYLKKDNIYMLEVIQGGKYFSKFSLAWKKSDQELYKTINDKNLFHKDEMSASPSLLKQKYNRQNLLPFKPREKRRNSFYQHQILQSNHLIGKNGMYCKERPKKKIKVSQLYHGYYKFTENVKIYPQEFFTYGRNDGVVLADKVEAINISNAVFAKLNKIHNNTLVFEEVVHIQHNYKKTYYFVEIDTHFKGDKKMIYRATHFVRTTVQSNMAEVCFIKEWESWKPHVEINLLTAIKNQRSWLEFMIYMLKELTREIGENNVVLNLIDFNSTDGNYQKILEASKLKYKYHNPLKGNFNGDNKGPLPKFNKVKMLNYGIKNVQNKNSIIFILDLHLQLPLNIFDRIRKLTVQGRTAFNPTLLKLACGEHEEFTEVTKSEWLDYGTGMMAMYKTDWLDVGGFNEKMFSNKWGGEDWEVMDRIVGKGIYIIHQRMPRFYHIYHQRAGMWS